MRKYSILIILPVLAICFCGCATKRFSETLTRTQDDGTPIITKTSDTSFVFWPPFAKTGPVAANLSYTWGGAENKIVSAQNTSDVDTTPQTEALKAMTAMISDVVAKVIASYISTPSQSATATGKISNALSDASTAATSINDILELVKKYSASK